MNKKKVLIISSPFFGYQESVGRAFEQENYEVKIETYDEPINPFRGFLRWQYKFYKNKEKLLRKSREKYNTYIAQIYHSYQPDIVFIFNGTILEASTLDYFRVNSKVILWMYDSIQNQRYTRCRHHIDHVDAFFCFEKKDVDYYANIGKTAYFLPLACDPVTYHTATNDRNIDIFFVGGIYGSNKRVQLLKMIANRYAHCKVLIYGMYKPYYKNPWVWLFREKRSIFRNANIPPAKVNELYNRCKIALNIHHEQTLSGANQRVFEICGAGAYQICDANPFIESLFPNGEVGLYHNAEELIACINDALHNDKSENAKRAQEIVLSGHTFVHRVKEILKYIEKQ